MQPDRLTDAQEAHVRRILREEMARLQPPQLRDLAVLCEAHAIVAHRGPIGPFFREEAARREAEASNPCKDPGACEVGGCLSPSACQAAAGEREGPGSAAAAIVAAFTGPTPSESAEVFVDGHRYVYSPKDKPTPAADELVTALDEIATAYGHSRIGRSAKAALSRIEAQARDLAGTQAIYRERDRAANEALFKLEASEARVRELERKNSDQRAIIDAEKARADRLAAALKFYANPEIYKPHPHGPAFDRRDLSFHAITALKETP